MKTLYLLRHAESESIFAQTDKLRHLTQRGRDDALRCGDMMATRGYLPDVVLCSAATRTRQTLAGVGQSVDVTQAQFEDGLYNASAMDLLGFAHNIPADKNHTMIIAHNPGIFELAVRLVNGAGAEKLGFNYPPCTLSVIDCDITDWADIQLGVNVLRG